MTDPNNLNPASPDAPEAPNALVQDMASLYGRSLDPSPLDDTILATARSHFEASTSPVVPATPVESGESEPIAPAVPIRAWWARWRVIEVASLAAVVALIVWIGVPDQQPRHDNISSGNVPLAGDVDRNGRVDILDAYQLQRKIETGDTLSSALDMTGDGQINRDDVSAIAQLAVRLEGGQRS